ncbi:TPA: hypothetical protein ACIJVJ_005179 [Raoultella planticola]|uniref:hypothetical protein n=1 Tax=Klebsiella TaxID=570 RepID=UPI000E2A93D4|nr:MULTISPECIES: hypothetical protein [Klebsiella]SVP39766.1 Uncharacterised protein [Klebsiella pneumoniae]HBQ1033624.1 hypothetical protein [Klebsiella pneumoniae]HDT6528798.1 hypothetical protein [Raoultella ornithinolytica]
MLDIMQDESGVILRNGDLVLDGGIDGIAQQAEIRVGTNRGEWWLDETQGLPWLPGIMASRLPVSIVSNMINAEARRTPGVTDARTTTINDVKGDYTIRFAVYVGADSTEVTSGIN